MLRSYRTLVAIVLSAGLASACGASIQERRAWPKMTGGGKHYKHPCPAVIEAGKKALDASSLSLEAEEAFDDKTHAIYAEAGPFLLRQGEVVRILFNAALGGCEVYLKAQAKMSGNVLKKGDAEYAMEYFLALDGHLATTTLDSKYGSLTEDEEEAAPPAVEGAP